MLKVTLLKLFLNISQETEEKKKEREKKICLPVGGSQTGSQAVSQAPKPRVRQNI